MTQEVQALLTQADREECAGFIRIARELRARAAAILEARRHA